MAKQRNKGRFSFLGAAVEKLPGMLEMPASKANTETLGQPSPPPATEPSVDELAEALLQASSTIAIVASLFQQYQLLQQSKLFDAAFYLNQNPDVVCAGLDPLLHYLEYGAAEGCAPSADFDVAYYQEQCQEAGIIVTNPLVHYA